MQGKPALVLLAAGASTRLGECKALVRLGSANPIELLVAAGACLDEVPPLLVTGADHAAIAAARPQGVEIVNNPAWSAGRTGGVRLAALRRPGLDLCLAPVDTPLVPAAVFRALLDAWVEAGSPSRGWLAPAIDTPEKKSHGHPVIVGRELVLELDDLGPDVPLKRLRERAAPLLSVPVEHPEILDDLDTPEDLFRLRRRSRG